MLLPTKMNTHVDASYDMVQLDESNWVTVKGHTG